MIELSLWLESRSVPADRLAQAIQRLAFAHASPVFVPHVTVLGGFSADPVEAAVAVRHLRRSLPVETVFTDLGLEDVVTRALYLRPVARAPFRALHECAAEALSVPASGYDPHLSLMYTSMPEEPRREIAAGLAHRLPVQVTFDVLSLWYTPEGCFDRWRRLEWWAGRPGGIAPMRPGRVTEPAPG